MDLGDGHGNYSMTMYVAVITDNCILVLDYLKAGEAVIDLSQKVTQVGLIRLDWLTTVIFFQIQ